MLAAFLSKTRTRCGHQVTEVVLKRNLSDCKSLAIPLWAEQSAAIGNMVMLLKGLKNS